MPPRRHATTLPLSPFPRAKEYVYIKRDAAEGEFYAELSIFSGDTVARLADRACAKFGWGVPTQARLYLVKRGGKRPAPEEEAAATPLDDPSDALAEAGIVKDAWLLARVSLPAAAAAAAAAVSAGAADAGRVAALLEQVLAGQARDRAERARDVERAYFDQLYIRPVFSPLSSGGSSNRSPRDEHRVALKIATIEYYGLWASAESDETARRVFTMLASSAAEEAAPVSVPFKEAILAHIWPSVLAPKALDAGGLLCLPEGFNVNPRNFLLLRKPVERAFDADALLLLPRRTAGEGQAVVARVFSRHTNRLPEAERALFSHAAVAASPAAAAAAAAAPACGSTGYDGRLLFLPRAADGRVPFMRLLAWKALSALRAAHEDADARADLPAELTLDATASSGAAALAGSGAAGRLTSAGLLFLPLK